MRKLASIREISEVLPIEGADLIELCIVDGWQCVTKKSQFLPGDRVIYCEIDSVLPVREEYEFLRKSSYKQADFLPGGEGFRLRTLQFRGQISQGLLLPLLPLHEGADLGADVTASLGIVKWDPPSRKPGLVKGSFPSYIPTTDQPRAQNLVNEVFQPPLLDTLWEVSLKLDGCSCTFYHYNGEIGVCSRNVNLKLDQQGNAFVDTFYVLDIASILPPCGNIAIQGELMGPGLPTHNRESLSSLAFYAFDVWDIDAQHYLHKGLRDSLLESLGIQSVPILEHSTTLKDIGCDTLQGMLEYVDRPSINNPVAEGAVFRSLTSKISGQSVSNPAPIASKSPYSFKCINNRYLISAG
jgi:RNA ligase (TIGR02306 family)